jgi:DNA-directed RNA polymerase specialized sigma24 family protein
MVASRENLVAQSAEVGSAPDLDAAPDEVPEAPAKPAAPIEPWRSKLLSDPLLHEHIRKVARLRGAMRCEVDDILSDVLLAALGDPNLPRSAGEARKRLGVVSRNKTIDRVRERGNALLSMSSDVRVTEAATEATHGASADLEALLGDRTQLEKILEIAKKRHPNTWHWAVRRYVHRDTVEEIAEDARKGERHVRMALQKILATCAAAATTVCCLFAVFFLRPEFLIQDESRTWSAAANTRPARTVEPPPNVVGKLREEAAFECDMGEFAKCADDLEAAYALDPIYETPAQAEMRKFARNNSAPMSEHGDGKPVVHPQR